MSEADNIILEEARTLLRENPKPTRDILIAMLTTWKKLERVEIVNTPFCFEETKKECLERTMAEWANIILHNAARIEF